MEQRYFLVAVAPECQEWHRADVLAAAIQQAMAGKTQRAIPNSELLHSAALEHDWRFHIRRHEFTEQG